MGPLFVKGLGGDPDDAYAVVMCMRLSWRDARTDRLSDGWTDGRKDGRSDGQSVVQTVRQSD